jgi:hypothetical protein
LWAAGCFVGLRGGKCPHLLTLLKEKISVELTKEQKDFLIFVGKPDDGSQTHVFPDAERLTQELIRRGLMYSTGKNSYDLTDEGERVYGELTGEDVS